MRKYVLGILIGLCSAISSYGYADGIIIPFNYVNPTFSSSVSIVNNTNGATAIATGELLHLEAADTQNTQMRLYAFGGTPLTAYFMAGGTSASKTAVVSGGLLSEPWAMNGWNGAAYVQSSDLLIKATENWDSTHRGTEMVFEGAITGTNARSTFLELKDGNTIVTKLLSFTASNPTISACGTSPSVDSMSSNNSGTVTVGTVAAASCTITFATAFATFNHCRVTSQGSVTTFAYSYTLSAITVTATSLVSDKIDYQCDGV